MAAISSAAWWVVPVMCVLGSGLLSRLTRRAGADVQVRRVVVSSYLLRVLVALTLYAISYYGWPVFKSLQTGGGYWAFGLDCLHYDIYGARILYAFKHGIELPETGLSYDYFLFVAGIYKFLGRHPLYVIVVNCWLSAVTALLAARIGQALFDRRAAILSAVLVGFWPSSLIWSAQLLKDSLGGFLIFSALYVLVKVSLTREEAEGSWRWIGWLLTLGGLVIALTRLRFYLGSIISLAVVVVLLPAAGYALIHRRLRRAVRYGIMCCVVVASMLAARSMDVKKALSPAHPEIGHCRIALEHFHTGDFNRAAEQYLTAVQLNPYFLDAYLGLAAVMVHQGYIEEPLAVYSVYLGQEEHPLKRQEVYRLMYRMATEFPAWKAVSARRKDGVFYIPGDVVALVDRTASLSVVRPRDVREDAADGRAGPIAEGVAGRRTGLSPRGFSRLVPAASGRGSAQGFTSRTLPAGIYDQAYSTAKEMTPRALGSMREGFVSSGGYSLMDAWARISTPKKLATYLPRALAIGLLAPFPWQWFDTRGSTGTMRAWASVEMLLLYLLLASIGVGAWRIVKQRRIEGHLILCFIFFVAVATSLVIANLGTLFRLRLQFLMPLLVVAAGGRPIELLRGAGMFFRRLGTAVIR